MKETGKLLIVLLEFKFALGECVDCSWYYFTALSKWMCPIPHWANLIATLVNSIFIPWCEVMVLVPTNWKNQILIQCGDSTKCIDLGVHVVSTHFTLENRNWKRKHSEVNIENIDTEHEKSVIMDYILCANSAFTTHH